MAYQPKSYRKFIAGTMTAAMAASAFAVTTPSQVADAQTTEFSDVSEDTFGYSEIYRNVERGIVGGFSDGTYRAGENVTRGQTARILSSALDLDVPTEISETPYDDLSAESVHAGPALAMREAGVMMGRFDDTVFDADMNLTREQMASILVRAYNLDPIEGEEVNLIDLDDAYQPHVSSIEILAQHGITRVETGEFRPKENVTRGQFAVFMDRALAVDHTIASGLVDATAVNETTVDIEFTNEQVAADAEQFGIVTPGRNADEVDVLDAEIIAGPHDEENVVRLTTSPQVDGEEYAVLYEDERTTLRFAGSGEETPTIPGDVEAGTDEETGLTTVTANYADATEGDTATITVTLDEEAEAEEEEIVVEDVEIGEDGEISHTFEEALPAGTHTVVVSVGEAASEPLEFSVDETEITVESVEAITENIRPQADQQLEFTVNGEHSLTVEEVEELGYDVEFSFSIDELAEDEEVRQTGLIDASEVEYDSFDYSVHLTDADGNEIESERQTVTVQSDDTIVEVTEIGLFDGQERIDENVITSNNQGNTVHAYEAVNAYGEVVEDVDSAELYLESVTSSDVSVAYYNRGEDVDNADDVGLQIVGEGEVTLTATFEGIEEPVTLDLEVVADEEISGVAEDGENPRYTLGAESASFTILDQYDQPWAQEGSVSYSITDADGETDSGDEEISNGEVSIDFDEITEAGDYTLAFTNEEGDTIGTVTLTFVELDAENVDEFTLTVDPETIDIAENDDQEFNLTISGTYEGADLTEGDVVAALDSLDGSLQAVTSDGSVVDFDEDGEALSLSFDESDTPVFNANPAGAGTATITLEQVEGDYNTTLADVELIVEDSTPQIDDLTLAEDVEALEITQGEDGWEVVNPVEQLTSENVDEVTEAMIDSVVYSAGDEEAVVFIHEDHGGGSFSFPASLVEEDGNDNDEDDNAEDDEAE